MCVIPAEAGIQPRTTIQKNTGYSTLKFDKIYFKKHVVKSTRHNTQESYHGLLRVRVKRSTNLNRKIMGWIDGICDKWGVVQW